MPPSFIPTIPSSFLPVPRYSSTTSFHQPSSIPCRHRASPLMSASSLESEPLISSSDRAEALPWPASIAGEEFKLLFMPFIMHQLSVMRSKLDDVKDLPFEQSLSFNSSQKRPARIESWQWRTRRFRKIRATYIDAGINAQVFNSVWYPSYEYELPLLGIDFLSFGPKKVLCVMDFQPLTQEKEYLKKYCEAVGPIKLKYEGLSGSMSKKFYNEAQFFSRQLVFAKFDSSEPVMTQLFPAFKEYIDVYVDMVKGATPDDSTEAKARVAQLQKDYDQYSAERDPAVGLFGTYWGQEWAERFTHEFLFSEAVPVPKEEKDKETARSK